MSDEPAIGVLELRSIARGYLALDAACKRAVVRVVRAEPITPGKYWFVIAGGEAEVDEALSAAVDVAADTRIDHVVLAGVHRELLRAIEHGDRARVDFDSVGALELGSIAATIRAGDAALKAAEVTLVEMRLARGIGGKGYFVVTGSLSDVEAAIAAGADASGESWLVGKEVIPNPDQTVVAMVGTRERA